MSRLGSFHGKVTGWRTFTNPLFGIVLTGWQCYKRSGGCINMKPRLAAEICDKRKSKGRIRVEITRHILVSKSTSNGKHRKQDQHCPNLLGNIGLDPLDCRVGFDCSFEQQDNTIPDEKEGMLTESWNIGLVRWIVGNPLALRHDDKDIFMNHSAHAKGQERRHMTRDSSLSQRTKDASTKCRGHGLVPTIAPKVGGRRGFGQWRIRKSHHLNASQHGRQESHPSGS